MNARTPHRDAIRILFILNAGGVPLTDPDDATVAKIFKGEARLHAFDFWMRNPDYLASELLDAYETTSDIRYRQAAEAIFESDEPDLRRVPMIRYLFGAYERLDDALSLLRSRDLVRITGIKGKLKVHETDFILTVRGVDVCSTAVAQEPVLEWYARRSTLVAEVAGARGGGALKEKQYEQATYAQTQLGGIIPPIGPEVQRRLLQLKQAA
ncbi:MAG: hypothetical protein AW10_01805 [Candidatus Accumulibacter appositus]|uniref:Uncharacterized protein n=1 Tax=Candidatus Accumulibacter appositus TaxID=1454003 RepID=A0A011PUJ9_9PROT|nr:hypothetical protein [Accumulibacter sp.]EXI80475.1 MAG: hypothetical protein AW10_01805 [Candidatus Accumulibacter appositus]HRF06482.1 hypothetical protein [Accumulibacter sp.]